MRGRVVPLRRRRICGGHQRGQGHRQGCAGAVKVPVFQQDDEPQVGSSRNVAVTCSPRYSKHFLAGVFRRTKTKRYRSELVSQSFIETTNVIIDPSACILACRSRKSPFMDLMSLHSSVGGIPYDMMRCDRSVDALAVRLYLDRRVRIPYKR